MTVCQRDIDRKDFSVELPIIIDKLQFISDALIDLGNGQKFEFLFDSGDSFRATGWFLDGIATELRTINSTLYP